MQEGGGGGGCGVSANEYCKAVHIVNFRDLTPYLVYDGSPVEILADRKSVYASAYHFVGNSPLYLEPQEECGWPKNGQNEDVLYSTVFLPGRNWTETAYESFGGRSF